MNILFKVLRNASWFAAGYRLSTDLDIIFWIAVVFAVVFDLAINVNIETEKYEK
jgi:hypothetical protein